MSALPDLIALPRVVSGSRATILWGVVLLVVIEAVGSISLLTSYFYLRLFVPDWPPAGIAMPDPGKPGFATALVVLGAVSLGWSSRGVRRGCPGRLRYAMPVGLALVAGYIALTVDGFGARDHDWSTNAYGSIVWLIDGFSLVHAGVFFALAAGVFAFALAKRLGERLPVATHAVAIYGYFVAVNSLFSYVTLYFGPRVL